MVKERSPHWITCFTHCCTRHGGRCSGSWRAPSEPERAAASPPLRMSFPAASKHVRVLEQARLVRRRVVGRTHLCTLAAKPLGQAHDFLEKYRRFWEESFEHSMSFWMN